MNNTSRCIKSKSREPLMLVPVKILDNMHSPRFLGDDEIAKSLPAEGQKVLWHFAQGATSVDDCTIIEGTLEENEGYYIKDILDGIHWNLYEFDCWYKEMTVGEFMRSLRPAIPTETRPSSALAFMHHENAVIKMQKQTLQ